MAKRKSESIATISRKRDIEDEEIDHEEITNGQNSIESEDNSDEEDEEDNEEVEEEVEEKKPNGHSGPPTKKQRKQLTAQDIQVARETAELFKSNIFKLQIDELLKELKLKESHVTKIEKVLHRLHELISHVPVLEDVSLEKAETLFNSKKVVIPFPDPKPSKLNYTFSYLPPKDISLVGSFGLKTGISNAANTSNSSNASIDISLTMPEQLFQPKDYLNYRALYKRAFYLAYLADNLIPLSKKNNLPIKISYHFLNDDILCPVLKLESISTDNPEDLTFHKTKFSINLLVAFPFGFFDTKKLLPDKNCIRVQTDAEELPPTPLYNASILSSTSYDYYLKFLYTTKKTTESFKDACILGRLWLQQRGFGSSINNGGFGHFEFAMLMTVLLEGGGLGGNKILLHGFSSYQLFKGTIKYLATMDLNSDGYVSFSSLIGENVTSKYKSGGFNVPTIFDKNTKLNILWKMTQSSYNHLKLQAVETLRLLNDVVYDRFDAILLQKSTFDQMKFDIVMHLTIPDDLIDSFGPLERISFITFESYIKHRLYKILKTGLNERVNLIAIRNEKVNSLYPLTKRKPSSIANNYIIGLSINPEESEKLVTKGPSNEDQELSNKFRSFWGSKSSLRRFKDGSIQHCVVWSIKDNEPIVLTIAKYVLDQHLSKEISTFMTCEINQFNNKLPPPLVSGSSKASGTLQSGITSLTNYSSLKDSFESMVKILTNLSLPLSIRSISAASPSMRYTSLLQPVPYAMSNPDFWNDAIIQFETSTRWPDELISLEKTKTAFLLKINELVGEETAYRSFITRDHSIPFNEDICLLNVLTPEGYGFRLRVLSERDEVLYLRAITNSDHKQKPLLQDIYLKFNQKYQGAVKHTRTIGQLATYYKFYTPTVRLFKQWLDSQLLLHHFSNEFVELIAIKPFVDPAPYTVPNSVEAGFLQILNFLSNWNWKEDALILDLVKTNADEDVISSTVNNSTTKLSDRLTIQAYRVIEENFDKIRKADPSGIKTQFFIGSKDDPSGILWTNDLSLPIASRLTALSRIAMQIIKSDGLSETVMDQIFTPALKDFDFIIKVKSNSLTVSSGILPPNSYKNLIATTTSFPEDVTAQDDLIQVFFNDLEKKFGNTIIFATRKYTGLVQDGTNVICGIFVPHCLGKKKFRANLGVNVKPSEEEEVVINKEAIFEQIKLLGGDLIESIKLKK